MRLENLTNRHMGRIKINEVRKWYDSVKDRYEILGRSVSAAISAILQNERIPFLAISHRVKRTESFVEKVRRKKYRNPQQECTDILGIRVITYIEEDTHRIAEILKKSFDIRLDDSPEKNSALGVDRVGYRSIHLVAGLGSVRAELPEFGNIHSLIFELQVRSVLQHAWAEIEHDRNYKLPLQLPSDLERRLFLVSGMLEIADREFNSISSDIQRYIEMVGAKSTNGDFTIELNTPSLEVYYGQIGKKFKRTEIQDPQSSKVGADKLVAELKAFGCHTLADVDALLDTAFLAEFDVNGADLTVAGVLRDAMMYRDIEKYFSESWDNSWSVIEEDTVIGLRKKYGELLDQVLMRNQILVDTDDVQIELADYFPADIPEKQ